MRAAVATGSSIEVRDDVPDPTPGPGQVQVHTIVCGICGSDLHAARHIYEKAGYRLVKKQRHREFGYDLVGETWELNL